MNKKLLITTIGIILALFLLITFSYKYNNYPSLKKAIEASWGDNVEILNNNKENNVVIFKENSVTQEIHVINNYLNTNETYKYTRDNEDGYIVNSPYMVRVTKIENLGNVIWGVIKEKEMVGSVGKVKVEFKNILYEQNFQVEGKVKNNVFIAFPPNLYNNTDFIDQEWEIETKFYDKNGNLLK